MLSLVIADLEQAIQPEGVAEVAVLKKPNQSHSKEL
jgi:hypothetical protein